ncbi:MAG: hypothetical protein DM484_20815 [Candidatus Methylumidiphilus alinenensis]|uniref:Helix-hairpin-helix DNA-binding motif class 1 domain-containing protein n=1 Tax=Candidatus Methylumidiphilus alinenensis TaxID=2202197 RepID=A0A2W4R3C6_9GAMM|nr:MAG: hypothetical protein DM484_20815 [Candidatus Methylumidiphilus alinenensis]
MKKIIIALFAMFLMTFAGFAAAVVDLNSATAAELDALKGVGAAKAKAIIDYRDKNGPFKSVDELAKVKGFGAKTVDKLRPELTVGGAAAPAVAPVAKPTAPAVPPMAKPTAPAPAAAAPKTVAPAPAPVPLKK